MVRVERQSVIYERLVKIRLAGVSPTSTTLLVSLSAARHKIYQVKDLDHRMGAMPSHRRRPKLVFRGTTLASDSGSAVPMLMPRAWHLALASGCWNLLMMCCLRDACTSYNAPQERRRAPMLVATAVSRAW